MQAGRARLALIEGIALAVSPELKKRPHKGGISDSGPSLSTWDTGGVCTIHDTALALFMNERDDMVCSAQKHLY